MIIYTRKPKFIYTQWNVFKLIIDFYVYKWDKTPYKHERHKTKDEVNSKLYKNLIEVFDRTLSKTNNEHLKWMQINVTHHPKSKEGSERKKRKEK